jgi:hypothetical protein
MFGPSRNTGTLLAIWFICFSVSAGFEYFCPNKSAPDALIILMIVAGIAAIVSLYHPLARSVFEFTVICCCLSDVIRCICLLIC